MIELDKKHKRGKRTFIYLFICYGWWLAILGLFLFYLTLSINFGMMHQSAENFLNSHPTWYITIPMISEWMILLGIALIFIAYLRANVFYRTYKFILDEYAVHLHRGLFFTRESTIPYRHISNVRIERPYHFRIFGISQVDIVTAADRNIDRRDRLNREFLIPIIDASLARQLARQLLESASKSRGKVPEEIQEELIDEETEEELEELDENEANEIDD